MNNPELFDLEEFDKILEIFTETENIIRKEHKKLYKTKYKNFFDEIKSDKYKNINKRINIIKLLNTYNLLNDVYFLKKLKEVVVAEYQDKITETDTLDIYHQMYYKWQQQNNILPYSIDNDNENEGNVML